MTPHRPIDRGAIRWLMIVVFAFPARAQADAWTMHTIDGSSRGADGVRLGDINADGLPDVVTGWEEGGIIRVALHPGAQHVRAAWPAVTIGRVSDPEDAVPVDVDGDGRLDVVSCCEGRGRAIHVHWAPDSPEGVQDENRWSTQPVPASRGLLWMYCLPIDSSLNGRGDLIVGSKNQGATISRLQISGEARDVAGWTLTPLCDAGWIMSLRATDMDGDGDLDVLFSDRKGPTRGCQWLENPSGAAGSLSGWRTHLIGGRDREVMFLDHADLDGDSRKEVVAATRDGGVLVFQQSTDPDPESWLMHEIAMPEGAGTGKAVRVADLDLNGRCDLVVSCENAQDRHGVFWLTPTGETDTHWSMREISGLMRGVKFDRIELLDVDRDGDLDVLTCEERDNLGVIWYENPVRNGP